LGTVIALILSVWITSFPDSVKRPAINRQYDPAALQTIAAVMNENNQREDEIVFSAQKRYLQLFSDAQIVFAPYTDYDGLTNFLLLNAIDYLFLNHSDVSSYPFFENFKNNEYGDSFVLIEELTDRNGQKLSLYRFIAEEGIIPPVENSAN